MTPDYLRSRFVYRDNISAYRLRNTENKLVLPQPRTDYNKMRAIKANPHLYPGVGWVGVYFDWCIISSIWDEDGSIFK